MSLKELKPLGKVGMWLVASFFFSIILCFIPVSDSFTQLHKQVIGESVVYVTLGYFVAIFLLSTDDLLFQENSIWVDVFKRLRSGIYNAYMFVKFMFFWCCFLYWLDFFTVLQLLNYLVIANITGVIFYVLKELDWTRIKERVAGFYGGIEVYHLTLTWHIMAFSFYTYLFVKILVTLISLKATWYSFGWVVFMIVVLGISVHRIWNVYINRKGTMPVQLRIKRKAFEKSRRSVEKATKYYEKLLKDKSNYQAQLEEKIKKNPDCEEAQLDNLMARIDSLDSRIQIGEQIKRNLEAEHAVLANEVQDIENNMPITQLRPNTHFTVPIPAYEELRERLRVLLIGRITFLQTTLNGMADANEEISRQLLMLNKDDIDVAILDSLINQQRRLQEIYNITNERAERYTQLSNILLANPLHADAFNEITNTDVVFTRLEALTREFAENEDALRIALAAQPVVEHNNDDHMGTDGYPICPHCQREHNNYDNDQLPYCCSDCQYEHQHCGICRKELPVDERGFNYCQGACQEEAFRRQGNGD